MVNSATNTPTATLLYGVHPADGSRAAVQVLLKPDPVTGESYKKNYGFEEKTAVIENVRGKEESVSLDTTGFQFYKHPSKLSADDFSDETTVRNEYYPESIDLIKKLTGATRVVIFDHTIRRRTPDDKEDTPDKRQPVAQVHVDQTTPASIARVHRHLPAEDVPKLLANRFQIINLWRPIEHPALDWPLALCDYRSVDAKKDVFPVALVYPDREGETFGVTYNENHKWKYLRGMTPEELVLIKCFDSVQDGSVALFTPHTGFQDPTTPEEAQPRRSIEIRALVFYD
ncbi:hypothetical protein HYPSUDRAFT_40936 [Hypholoma sublateritium FD-334 SS-4]|uniref:Methyltransferase n=1 Tax=Hypholoma sublateritium (strain FD-334 SS-4) TaxID=945553 RepID=A0A0D2MG09_HYPSF|nr:hypothetical protein HYPSUDRAFT_40936 [Hypholoma sublateritium FD-334 SS-4]